MLTVVAFWSLSSAQKHTEDTESTCTVEGTVILLRLTIVAPSRKQCRKRNNVQQNLPGAPAKSDQSLQPSNNLEHHSGTPRNLTVVEGNV